MCCCSDTALKQDANNKAFDKFSETKKKTTEVKADGGASKRYMCESGSETGWSNLFASCKGRAH